MAARLRASPAGGGTAIAVNTQARQRGSPPGRESLPHTRSLVRGCGSEALGRTPLPRRDGFIRTAALATCSPVRASERPTWLPRFLPTEVAGKYAGAHATAIPVRVERVRRGDALRPR